MAKHLQLLPGSTREAGGRPGASPEVIRVVLADDHDLMRARLRHLLEDEADIDVIGDTGELVEAVRRVHRCHPHVLVLDMSMPAGSSVAAIARLREHMPDTQIVALRMEASPAYARHALAAGALGFVLKDSADTELVEAVRRAAAGEAYVSPRVAPALAGELAERQLARTHRHPRPHNGSLLA